MTIDNNMKLDNITIYNYDGEYNKELCKFKDKIF